MFAGSLNMIVRSDYPSMT